MIPLLPHKPPHATQGTEEKRNSLRLNNKEKVFSMSISSSFTFQNRYLPGFLYAVGVFSVWMLHKIMLLIAPVLHTRWWAHKHTKH